MRSSEKIIDHFIKALIKELPRETKTKQEDQQILLTYQAHKCLIHFFKETPFDTFKGLQLPIDLLATKKDKLISIIQSKLHYTRKVYARQCIGRRIETVIAERFLNEYHLMSFASSAFHYGLFDSAELIAVASFSKGRKMNRLEEHQRSFELVRFCCKEGITVTGGLTKLLKNFADEKDPGDIMTYVDKQLSEGASYLKCGFKLHSETKKQEFLVNTNTFERSYYKGEEFDAKKFYISENLGNLKLVYTLDKN
ncbi:MAG: hypothetical protein IPG08_07635 [Sphingobacteriaceae bacterium]|nr:hypothetical protein [Sphingobacteriaceae bacterium]